MTKEGKVEKVAKIEIPEFNPEEYVTENKRSTITGFISFLFAILMAIVSWQAGSKLGIIVGVVAVFLLPAIFSICKIDIHALKTMDWVWKPLTYILTWIMAWTVLLNPPF